MMAATDSQQGGGPYIEFLEEWAKFADSVVERWAGFGKRSIRHPSDREDFFGPYQDLWMTMASAVGDLTEMSYRWAQAVDGMAGFARGPRGEGYWYDDDDDDGRGDDPDGDDDEKPASSGKDGGTKTTTKAGTETKSRTPKNPRRKPTTNDK